MEENEYFQDNENAKEWRHLLQQSLSILYKVAPSELKLSKMHCSTSKETVTFEKLRNVRKVRNDELLSYLVVTVSLLHYGTPVPAGQI